MKLRYTSPKVLWKGLGTPEFLPGYDPVLDAKLKSKSARKNERKKEKKQQQAALEKGKNLESNSTGEVPSAEDVVPRSEAVESVAHQMNTLAVSEIPSVVAPSADSTECSSTWGPGPDIDKRIRALKKKRINTSRYFFLHIRKFSSTNLMVCYGVSSFSEDLRNIAIPTLLKGKDIVFIILVVLPCWGTFD
ncbi:partner of Y14 and mago-like isoform X4 [Telopea speciosissima]|uniref:partner of Y14 and mago-like isoform X4 n=1 Tax=Telopea speciosissima TaxID=54955 RepID=UPI001CC7DCE8|nr:partner of Y14 and mago-like isoform X4 [Telopea speciosissima]